MPIPPRSFYFLRHGQTDWNAAGRFQGHTDVALNALGVSQAHRAAQARAACPIDIIVASPLIRALTTAAIVAERLNQPLFADSALKERHFGAFEGLVVDEVKRRLGLERMSGWCSTCRPTRSNGMRPARAPRGDRHLARPPPGQDSRLLFVTHAGLFDALHERIVGARLEPYL
jgi:broad specificity phosphatase PhoE